MPMLLNVGASRKVTDHNYGSRGASVNLELELDSALIAEPARLQEKIRHLFGLVRTSLAEELDGGNGHAPKPPAHESEHTGPSLAASNGNGAAPPNGGIRLATPAQVKAIYGIAKRHGLNVADWLFGRTHVRRPDELSLQQASQVIDLLKAQGNQPAA